MPYKNPERKREYNKRYFRANHARLLKQQGAWRRSNAEMVNAYNRNWRLIRKVMCIEVYGPGCYCCGEEMFEFLTLDHVRGGGRRMRLIKKNYSGWLDAVARDFPNDLRLACYNCNCARNNGLRECPHSVRS